MDVSEEQIVFIFRLEEYSEGGKTWYDCREKQKGLHFVNFTDCILLCM
jgi:hypothetical protein